VALRTIVLGYDVEPPEPAPIEILFAPNPATPALKPIPIAFWSVPYCPAELPITTLLLP
jgi:hypothetical protein